MSISAAQCRAARALLDWSQDKLAESALVARATIVDFERIQRTPMRQNLASLESCFEAAGIAFIGEEDGGAGVRFREVHLEYIDTLRPDRVDGVNLPVSYRGSRYLIVIPRATSEDIDRTNHRTIEEQKLSVQRKLHVYLTAAEHALDRGDVFEGNRIVMNKTTLPGEWLL
jgi:transcriptional regulator with XRE-family HTH domain